MTDAPAKDRSGSDHRKGLPLAFLIFGVAVLFAIGATALVTAGTDDIGSGSPEGELQGRSNDGGAGSGTGGASLEGNQQAAETEGSSAGGTLEADGTDLFGAGGSVDAEQVVGRQAVGERLRVLQVVPGEGFFVGTGETDRVYVEFGGDVGEDETSELPRQGETVDLRGPVRPAPQDARRTLRLDEEQAADVEQDGFFVNADEVVAAG